MNPVSIEELRGVVKGRYRGVANAPAEVTGVTIDTRTAGAGELYIALRGQHHDGHDFLTKAVEAGCVGAVVAADAQTCEDLPERMPGGVIEVADTVEALGLLGRWHRGELTGRVIAVTGSNGKTTVKRMIHHILADRFNGSASPRSFNNAIGVPLTLLAAGPADDYVVCELGTSAPGEIAALADMARPDVAVITGIAEAHLERLGSLEAIAAEKASILGGLADGGIGVVQADQPLLREAVSRFDVPLRLFGFHGDADVCASDCRSGPEGTTFLLNGQGPFSVPTPGGHNASNAAAAVAVAMAMGMDLWQAANRLADFAGVEMRMERLHAGSVLVLNDAYNANPASVRAAGEVLAGWVGRRRVMVVGDMLELGPDSAQLHRQTGEALSRMDIERIVGVGELGGLLAQSAERCGTDARAFADLDALRSALSDVLGEGDVVLLKGSRGAALERLIPAILERFGPADRQENK